jgi:hypothetical protein
MVSRRFAAAPQHRLYCGLVDIGQDVGRDPCAAGSSPFTASRCPRHASPCSQVAEELLRTYVTTLDRICLKLSDDAEAAAPMEFVSATQDVRDMMLQRLAARATRRERSLFPSAKADLQAAFHFLDSANDARSMFAKKHRRVAFV